MRGQTYAVIRTHTKRKLNGNLGRKQMMPNSGRKTILKSQAIKQLSKVKLVIGNGFDLQCGMQSSYKDYFDYVSELNDAIEKWAKGFDALKSYLTESSNESWKFWHKLEDFNNINVWDCFFCFKIYENIENRNWCSIEAEIMRSFFSEDSSPAFWKSVFLEGQSPRRYYIKWDPDRKIGALAAFIKHKRNEKWFSSDKEFYFFLLDELKQFEKRFGLFIKKQQNDQYKWKYECLVSDLCNFEELISIDSFNYSVLGKHEINQININGDYKQPIFGIDSRKESPSNPIYIFTKTYRRIENETDKKNIEADQDFENVVVYGHSLSSYDYSYFFPLLDKLRLYDFTAKGQVVFAYSIYDKKHESKIKTDYRFAIAKLIEAYAVYRGLSEPNRLLDSLSIFRRIWLYELS